MDKIKNKFLIPLTRNILIFWTEYIIGYLAKVTKSSRINCFYLVSWSFIYDMSFYDTYKRWKNLKKYYIENV